MAARKGKMGRAIARLIVAALLVPLHGLYFMLAVGIAHRDWWPQVPVIGYGDAVVIAFLMTAIVSSTVATSTDKELI